MQPCRNVIMRFLLPLLVPMALVPAMDLMAQEQPVFDSVKESQKDPAKEKKGAAALGLLKAIDEGFVQVYEKVAPSVVVIDARRKVEDDKDARGFEFLMDEEGPSKDPKGGKGGAKPFRLPER